MLTGVRRTTSRSAKALVRLWLGPLDRLTEIVEEVRADHIVVALRDRRGHLPLEPLLESRVRGVVVEDALEFYERLTGKMAIEALTPGALIIDEGLPQPRHS